MANALKGEVEIVSGGTTYTLVYTTNSIATVEDLLGGKSIGEIMQSLAASPGMGIVRALLWGALLEKQKGIDLIKVGAIIDDFEGGLAEIAEKIGRTIRFRISRTPIDAPLDQ